MIPRLFGVSLAAFATLTVAAVCFAQDAVLPPGADTVRTALPPVTPMYLIKRGSFGGGLGWGTFIADGDYTKSRAPDGSFGDPDTRSRPSFGAAFRYQVAPWLRWQIAPGYQWVGYTQDSPIPFPDRNNPGDATKEKMLSQLMPVSFQLQYTQRRGGWLYHAGAGPGLYRVWVQNRRKVLADPVSLKRHNGWYPGASGEIGVARYLKSLTSVSIEGTLDAHWAFSTRDEQFPSGFNAHVFAVGLRVGANYHFDPRRFGSKSSTPAVPAR